MFEFLSNKFIKIDELLFRQIDILKKSIAYSKYLELFRNLDEETKKIINQLLIFIVLLIPLLVVLFFFLDNISMKNSIDKKEKILFYGKKIISNQQDIHKIESKVISKKSIMDQNKFKEAIQRVATSSQVTFEKITVSDFKFSVLIDKINKSTAKINFKKFSMIDVEKFFAALMSRNRMMIDSILLYKDNKDNLLYGYIHISCYSKEENNNS